ncbi:hypothetical protein [Rickettsia sp. Tenjiku01]|uniref:hypothetical protein n=1 Tax=Rickettsia sp. Tenjiku01 TaxID=1736693 RepID=UPI000AFE1C64|nr:hypothetical protein [Rickettsia sp. Tenjiku01]
MTLTFNLNIQVGLKTFNIANNKLLNFATDTSPAAGLYVNEVMDIQPIEIVSSSAAKMLLMT